jgi:hypothetical protein
MAAQSEIPECDVVTDIECLGDLGDLGKNRCRCAVSPNLPILPKSGGSPAAHFKSPTKRD